MTKKYYILTLLCILTFAISGVSQTSLYSEDFTGDSGKGAVGPTPTYDTAGMTWTIDISATSLTASSDYFKVNASEQFEGKDLDGEAIWYSPFVDISSVASANLSVDVAETGSLAGTEYIRVYYILDNGSETLFETNGDNTDDFTSATASQDSLIGDSVQIIIKVYNNAGTKTHTFDNITVIENISNVIDLYDLTDADSITLNWTDPASSFDEILIVANEDAALSAGTPTGDGTAYTANTTIGSGTSLLGGTVVFKSTGNTGSFGGLTNDKDYYIKVFTRKGSTWSQGNELVVSYNPPAVGDVLITEYARHATISDYSYLELYNTTSSDINLSGCKVIINNSGSTSQIVDLRTDINEDVVVPANGFLILNRDRSKTNFESTWNVDLDNTGSDVNYIRTEINNFGNNKLFVLKSGGTEGTDDGTLIDETTEFANALGKRVYQLPLGHWDDNINDAADYATPGSMDQFENLTLFDLGYTDAGWLAATGYAHSSPSASTGSANAVIIRGEATFTTGSALSVLAIWPEAGTSISTESITISSGLYLDNNASLAITSTGSVTCAGDISIEREGFNAGTDYNAWGSPYSSTLRIDSVFVAQNHCDIYALEASTQGWKHDYTVGETIDCGGFSYTVTAANVIASPECTPDGSFDAGRGYFIVGNSENSYPFNVTGGTLNNGTINVNIYGSSATTVDGTNDWNLLSNPYPSSLSADDFLSDNSSIITNAVYLYNPNTGMNTASSYDTYNSTDGYDIASCQGFFVDANTSTDGLIGTASFTNSMRTSNNTDFRSTSSSANYSGIYLKATNASHVSDQTRLYFNQDCLETFDKKFDAHKLENAGFNFCSKADSRLLVFNGLPEISNNNRIIPLYFQTYDTGSFTISIDSIFGGFSTKKVLLEDRLNKTFHKIEDTDYTFTTIPKTWDNRFFLHIITDKTSQGTGGVDVTTGVNEIDASSVVVFASEDELIVSSSNADIQITQVTVHSVTGQLAMRVNKPDSMHRLNISGLSSGIYMVNYQLENGDSATKKVVIQ